MAALNEIETNRPKMMSCSTKWFLQFIPNHLYKIIYDVDEQRIGSDNTHSKCDQSYRRSTILALY